MEEGKKSLNIQPHENKNIDRDSEDSPPIFKNWARLYAVVMINLVFWLLTFYIIRRIFE